MRKDADAAAMQSIFFSEYIICTDSTPQGIDLHFRCHLPLVSRRGAHVKRIDTSIMVEMRAYYCSGTFIARLRHLHCMCCVTLQKDCDRGTGIDHAVDVRVWKIAEPLRCRLPMKSVT